MQVISPASMRPDFAGKDICENRVGITLKGKNQIFAPQNKMKKKKKWYGYF
jgi:hypothetical protein